MKRPIKEGDRKERSGTRGRIKHLRGVSQESRLKVLLRSCLEKIGEIQGDLQRGEDPEAAGYVACALETLRFLSAEGVPPEHPMVRGLAEHFMRNEDN